MKLMTAEFGSVCPDGSIQCAAGPFPVQMALSQATALPLVAHDGFGADLIRFGPGERVEPHTHPGAHILLVMHGRGVLEYQGEHHKLFPGLAYLIPPNVSHAIYADEGVEELTLFAVGNDHRPAWSRDRLQLDATKPPQRDAGTLTRGHPGA